MLSPIRFLNSISLTDLNTGIRLSVSNSGIDIAIIIVNKIRIVLMMNIIAVMNITANPLNSAKKTSFIIPCANVPGSVNAEDHASRSKMSTGTTLPIARHNSSVLSAGSSPESNGSNKNKEKFSMIIA